MCAINTFLKFILALSEFVLKFKKGNKNDKLYRKEIFISKIKITECFKGPFKKYVTF